MSFPDNSIKIALLMQSARAAPSWQPAHSQGLTPSMCTPCYSTVSQSPKFPRSLFAWLVGFIDLSFGVCGSKAQTAGVHCWTARQLDYAHSV